MNYIKDDRYPITLDDIRKENPQTSFPTNFDPAAFGYSPVFTPDIPPFDEVTQAVRELAPALVDGQWREQWEVYALPANTVIQAQIAALEAQITNRRVREAIRGSGKAWLDGVDDQIAALRAQLK